MFDNNAVTCQQHGDNEVTSFLWNLNHYFVCLI